MSDKKYIRFIDSSYNTLFHIPDGGSIRVHSKWDNQDRIFKCKYLSSHHVEISGTCYHICQFAEMMERNGSTYEPVTEIGDLDFYEKKYYDRDNLGDNDKPIPYYSLVDSIADKGTSEEVQTVFAFCFNPAEPSKAFCKFVWKNYSSEFSKEFSSNIEDLCDNQKLCSRIRNIIASILETQGKATPSLDEQIAQGAAQISEKGSVLSSPVRENVL